MENKNSTIFIGCSALPSRDYLDLISHSHRENAVESMFALRKFQTTFTFIFLDFYACL